MANAAAGAVILAVERPVTGVPEAVGARQVVGDAWGRAYVRLADRRDDWPI